MMIVIIDIDQVCTKVKKGSNRSDLYENLQGFSRCIASLVAFTVSVFSVFWALPTGHTQCAHIRGVAEKFSARSKSPLKTKLWCLTIWLDLEKCLQANKLSAPLSYKRVSMPPFYCFIRKQKDRKGNSSRPYNLDISFFAFLSVDQAIISLVVYSKYF